MGRSKLASTTWVALPRVKQHTTQANYRMPKGRQAGVVCKQCRCVRNLSNCVVGVQWHNEHVTSSRCWQSPMVALRHSHLQNGSGYQPCGLPNLVPVVYEMMYIQIACR